MEPMLEEKETLLEEGELTEDDLMDVRAGMNLKNDDELRKEYEEYIRNLGVQQPTEEVEENMGGPKL